MPKWTSNGLILLVMSAFLHVQELHQIAQGLLSNLLRNLCSYQVEDTFAARAPTIAPQEAGSISIETWLPERYGSLEPDVCLPAWREPSAEQVGCTILNFVEGMPDLAIWQSYNESRT